MPRPELVLIRFTIGSNGPAATHDPPASHAHRSCADPRWTAWPRPLFPYHQPRALAAGRPARRRPPGRARPPPPPPPGAPGPPPPTPARAGLDTPIERIVSAASAPAAHVARRHPGGRIFLISTTDARAEFAGLDLMTGEEADQPEARAAAVVIGYASDELTFATLDRAFRLLRAGAGFVAMHKNRWWLTKRGVTLDSGGLVVGLEYATERRAAVVGKPTKAFFLEAVRELAAETGPPGLHTADVAMIGDDLWHDVLGAQRAGLRGVFVRSGKHGDEDLARGAAPRPGGGRARAGGGRGPGGGGGPTSGRSRRHSGARLAPLRRPPDEPGDTEMTSPTAPRLKVTYATLRADNEELHAAYEAGLERAKARLGAHHRNFVGGRERDGEGTFEVRSPIDRDVVVGTFAHVLARA